MTAESEVNICRSCPQSLLEEKGRQRETGKEKECYREQRLRRYWVMRRLAGRKTELRKGDEKVRLKGEGKKTTGKAEAPSVKEERT